MRYLCKIKTVDGDRFEYVTNCADGNPIFSIPKNFSGFLRVDIANGTKYFNVKNIVSVTLTRIDDGKEEAH